MELTRLLAPTKSPLDDQVVACPLLLVEHIGFLSHERSLAVLLAALSIAAITGNTCCHMRCCPSTTPS